MLFAVRWKLGAVLGWDRTGSGVGARAPSLRDRLPRDLRDASQPTDADDLPLTPVYQLDNEMARELANRTVHAVMHLGWVPGGNGDHELRMAVLVKANGRLGRLYMALIRPFRYLVVYPALTRQWETAWRDRCREGSPTSAGGVDGAVGVLNIPASVRAASSLPDADYADAFTLSTDVTATPEQWARAMFGDVPSIRGRVLWRGLLGLRLHPGRSAESVAGWRVAARGEDWIRLEAASWYLAGNLVVHATDGRVSLGTFLRYDRPPARVIWTPASAVHRQLAPGLLRDAAAELHALGHSAGTARRDRTAPAEDASVTKPDRPRREVS
jgi:hypothetical protein